MVQTWKRSATYVHTVLSGEAAAGTLDLNIASGSAPTDDLYFIGQVRRAGVDVSGFDFDYTSGTGLLTVADAGAAALTEDDVVVVMGSWVTPIKP